MKKRIILCATCIAIAGMYVQAQQKSDAAAPPESALTQVIAEIPPPPPLPPPPPPPAPPLPPSPPTQSSIDNIEQALPPAPPEPPAPPLPAPVPGEEFVISSPEPIAATIINSNGYEMSLRNLKGKEMVIVNKEGKSQKIKRITWNANRKSYEKKFGHLPAQRPVDI